MGYAPRFARRLHGMEICALCASISRGRKGTLEGLKWQNDLSDTQSQSIFSSRAFIELDAEFKTYMRGGTTVTAPQVMWATRDYGAAYQLQPDYLIFISFRATRYRP